MPPPFPEPKTLDHLLAQVSRLHYQRAHEVFDKLGLYRGQPPMLFALWERDGQTHSELAQGLGIAPATTTKMIQRMEKAGFVQRQPDARDQRVSRVYLTEAGRTVRASLEAAWDQMDAENFSGLSQEERGLLHSYLLRVRANLAQAIQEKPTW